MEEARFTELCNNGGLSLNPDVFTEALALFNKLKQDIVFENDNQNDRYWFGFILYSVKRLSQTNSNSKGPSLCQILKATKLTMKDFFKEMPGFVSKAGPVMRKMYGEDWEKRLEVKELHSNGGMNFLRNSYDRIYADFFKFDDKCCRFGWLLFLALRSHAFSKFKDVVSCTSGLVSVLSVLILHVPLKFRSFRIGDMSRFVRNENGCVELVQSLCRVYDVGEDELRMTIGKLNDVVVCVLKKKPCVVGEKFGGIETKGLVYFQGLMEEESLSSTLIILENYGGGQEDKVSVNDVEDVSMSEGAKRKFDDILVNESPQEDGSYSVLPPSSPALSPEKRICLAGDLILTPPPPMTAAEWLRTVIAPLPSKPSGKLDCLFSSFDKNITGQIACREHIILEAIFPTSALQSANLTESIWIEQRRREASKLYYKVLEAICTAESQVGNDNKLFSILSNESFHRCMLACSAELVLATDKTVSILFPVVLERTGITAFDLSKVIESFVRYEVSLPRELRRHLNSLEERLLESMVWQKGSSLYNSLAVANPALSAEVSRLGLLAKPMPSLYSIANHFKISFRGLPYQFPPEACRTSFQSACASQRSSDFGGNEACAQKRISLLFSKISKLAAIRINGMVERLKMDQHIRETVYSLMQQTLKRVTTLFFNRHIDQIILCSLYSVAKIFQIKLTFEEIVRNYKRLPQSRPQVYRSVFVDWSSTRHNGRTGQEYIGIVPFYNQVFIPSMQQLLKEVSLASGNLHPNLLPEANNKVNGQASGSPRVSSFPRLPDMSPKKVSAAHNVFVSPLQSSKIDSLISYSSKSYYAFIGQSTQAYRIPSRDLSDINNQLNGKTVIRNLDPENDSFISDSHVVKNLNLTKANSASTSGRAVLFPPVKFEQPDSQ